MWSEVGETGYVWVRQLTLRHSSRNNEEQFEVPFYRAGSVVFVSTHLVASFQLSQPSLNILSRWIELHLSREWMEIKLLHNAWATLPRTWQSGKCCISKPYDVSQTRGEVKREKREEERESRAQPYSRTDNWHSRKTSRRLSSPSRRLSAGPLPKFLRPLWTTKRGGMFGRLSGKRHFRAHSCHSPGTWILPQRVQWWRAGRGRYAFYLKMASCERTWNQNWLLWYSLAHTAPLLLSAPSSQSFFPSLILTHFCPFTAPRTFSSSFFFPPQKRFVFASTWISKCFSVVTT